MTPYADRQYAETYFLTRLHSGSWFGFSAQDRDAALVTATRQIDRLNFAGEKNAAYVARESYGDQLCYDEAAIATAGAEQETQFPRGSDTVVPDDIKIACCEIAFELLNGKDPQIEYENLATVSQGIASARKTLDRSFVQEHIAAGIVSVLAWNYLSPYLRDVKDFKIIRVS
jgi:hypothetical protein